MKIISDFLTVLLLLIFVPYMVFCRSTSKTYAVVNVKQVGFGCYDIVVAADGDTFEMVGTPITVKRGDKIKIETNE